MLGRLRGEDLSRAVVHSAHQLFITGIAQPVIPEAHRSTQHVDRGRGPYTNAAHPRRVADMTERVALARGADHDRQYRRGTRRRPVRGDRPRIPLGGRLEAELSCWSFRTV